MYWSWIVAIATFVGGWFFARAYLRHGFPAAWRCTRWPGTCCSPSAWASISTAATWCGRSEGPL
ncbi:hypothetical protein [Paracoccus marcusii]|uniref:hypothetical protein n=1 Tax=Paracoccus marcusii TaxID=59779 RepID=UPI0039C8A23C